LERTAVTRLIWAEISRLLSRRLTGIAMILILLGVAGYQLVVNDALSPPSGEERAAAERSYQQAHEDWAASREQYERECRDSGTPQDDCVIPEPTLVEFMGDPTPFKEAASTSLKLSTLLVALVTFTIAASFIGAEYSSGSIINWLTFVPRRSHVFWSKLLAVVGFAALLGTLAATLVLSASLILARLHGSPVEAVPELAGLGVRGVLPVVVLAALGFCVGLLTRHTAGAIGILLAVLVVCFVRIGALSTHSWAQRITPWTPEGNIAALIDRGYTYAVPVEKVTREGVAVELVESAVSLTHGLVYWSIILTLVIMGSLLIFRHRDVI
jgi:ABC-2 type transport system permease protein